MMMGVAQVIGMNPTLRSFFSIGPPCANTSVAVASGKNCASAASAVEAPTDLRKARRAASCGNIARITAEATDPSVALLGVPGRALDRRALELPLRVVVVLGLAAMAPAPATLHLEPMVRIEGFIESRHRDALLVERGIADELAMGVPIDRLAQR